MSNHLERISDDELIEAYRKALAAKSEMAERALFREIMRRDSRELDMRYDRLYAEFPLSPQSAATPSARGTRLWDEESAKP